MTERKVPRARPPARPAVRARSWRRWLPVSGAHATATEERLRALEQRHDDLVSELGEILTEVDLSGQLTFLSPAWTRLTGYPVAASVGRSIHEFVHPDDVPGVRAALGRVASGEQRSAAHEFRLVTASQTLRWVRGNGRLRDAGEHVVGTITDVTEARAAEEQLRREREFLRALLDSLSEGIIACDEHGRVSLSNAATRLLYGADLASLRPDEWVGHLDIRYPDGEPVTTAELPLLRALRGEHVRAAELVVAPLVGGQRRMVVNGRPIVDGTGRTLGAVVAFHDVTDRVEATERLRRIAHFDPLTGLPNRFQLTDRLAHALTGARRREQLVAVLLLDVDRFKVVNDSLGHDRGDEVLRTLARRLGAALPPGASLGRSGGDEFVVVLDGLPPDRPAALAAAVEVCELLERTLVAPVALLDREIFVTASVGIALGDGAERPEALLADADAAMYQAKERGKGRHEVFDDVLRAKAVRRLQVESDLHRALEREELRVLYQPTVDLRTGLVCGVEALVRWRHPYRGMLVPADFLDVAEDTGLVVDIGSWVLEQACRQLVTWQDQLPGLAATVSVNLSERQLLRRDFADEVAAQLHAAGLAPDRLCVEITEGMLDEPSLGTRAQLAALRRLGVRIALDDFGAGSGTLSHLRELPIDVVKIDGTLVTTLEVDPQAAGVISGVVSLAHAVGLRVVVEGLDSAPREQQAVELGADEAQGYLYGRPMDASAARALLGHRGETPARRSRRLPVARPAYDARLTTARPD